MESSTLRHALIKDKDQLRKDKDQLHRELELQRRNDKLDRPGIYNAMLDMFGAGRHLNPKRVAILQAVGLWQYNCHHVVTQCGIRRVLIGTVMAILHSLIFIFAQLTVFRVHVTHSLPIMLHVCQQLLDEPVGARCQADFCAGH